MKLFIDTNIFLSFYHYSSEDLEELKKLGVLISQGRAELYLPEQVRDEFARNRATKINDALRNIRSLKLSIPLPQIAKDYPEYGIARKALAEADRLMAQLQAKMDADIANVSLKADRTIAELFEKATRIPTDSALVALARQRVDLGNPPGKNNSHGDAINWEALLKSVPDGEDLYFITDDGDYQSPLDSDLFDPFLGDEWLRRKKSSIRFHKRLSGFFKEKFPQVKLASELEKDLVIRELATAGSFASAKATLRRLAQYSDLTDAEANAIADAAGTNNQVYWIIQDADVEPYFRELLRTHGGHLDPSVLKQLKFRFGDISLGQFFGINLNGDDEEGSK